MVAANEWGLENPGAMVKAVEEDRQQPEKV